MSFFTFSLIQLCKLFRERRVQNILPVLTIRSYACCRSNFLYDREQRQKAQYQAMNMRIEQAALWREDLQATRRKNISHSQIVNSSSFPLCVRVLNFTRAG